MVHHPFSSLSEHSLLTLNLTWAAEIWVGPLEAIPELVMVDMVMACKIDYSVHCYLS